MKTTIETDSKTVSVESSAIAIDEVVNDIAGLLLAIGFHPNTVASGMECYGLEHRDAE